MKAMIFAAGLGTRLKPITDTMPKALVPINGKPLLQHILEKLIDSGFDEIVINLHHFPNQIIDFLRSKNNFGVRIELSDESGQLLDTGGGLKKARYFFDDGKPFLVHNVDILSNINLGDLYSHTLNRNALATLLVSERKTTRYLLFNNDLNLTGWTNISTHEIKSPEVRLNPDLYRHLSFSGIHILSPHIFSLMDAFPSRFSIIDFYLSICDKHNVSGYIYPDSKILDVGKLDMIEAAERFVTIQQ